MAKNKKQSLWPAFKVLPTVLILAGKLLQPTPIGAGEFVLEEGITFGTGGDVDLKLDLARPETGEGPFPALVYIYGSGWGYWTGGSRTQCQLGIMQAAERGYVAVTVDYRQTSVKENGKTKYLFPAQLYDVKCAIRWLRANAKKYNIDSNHIGVAGFSSGGHLALMLGLTTPSDALEGYCGDNKITSGVQAVVNACGETELVSLYNETAGEPERIVDLLGGTPQQRPSEYATASPLTYVRRDAPPVLSIYGDIDYDVPIKQAYLLDRKMKEVGAFHTLIIRKNTGHKDFTTDPEVLDFFDKYLRE
jgi:acetyl esterase/lipase